MLIPAMGGTFVSDMAGTFESDTGGGGTYIPLLSTQVNRYRRNVCVVITEIRKIQDMQSL